MNGILETYKIKHHTEIDGQSINDIDLLSCLTNDEISLVEQKCPRSRFKRGAVLYYEGMRHTGIYCILKGVINVFKIGPLGKEQILRFGHKGDIIAYRSLFSNEKACSSAKVIDDAIVCYIPHDILMQLFESNWEFRLCIMKMMCKELRESNSSVAETALKSVRERTADMLLHLHDEFGESDDHYLNIRITRVQLASRLGIATESVIRELTSFKKENLISCNGRQIKILNPDRLKYISDFQLYQHYRHA